MYSIAELWKIQGESKENSWGYGILNEKNFYYIEKIEKPRMKLVKMSMESLEFEKILCYNNSKPLPTYGI